MEAELLVSVVMPAYNSAAFVKPAIESVLAQTYSRFELLVINDGSSDETAAIAAAYQERDFRVQIHSLPHGGIAACRNHGLQLARGAFIAWLDADDLAHPHRLALQVAALQSNPDLVILGSAFQTIDEQDTPGAIHRMPEQDTAIRWHCLFHSPFAQSSVICRIEALRTNGLSYDLSMPPVEDYELWSRLLQHGRGYNLSQPLLQYRTHSAQASRQAQPQVWELASQVSQKNLNVLGAVLPLDQVQRLRAWYYAFPGRFSGRDLLLAEALLNVLNRFSLQPGLDAAEVQRLRGRWLGRLLRAAVRGGKVGWTLWLWRQISLDDIHAVRILLRERDRVSSG